MISLAVQTVSSPVSPVSYIPIHLIFITQMLCKTTQQDFINSRISNNESILEFIFNIETRQYSMNAYVSNIMSNVLVRLSELNENIVFYLFPVNRTQKYAYVILKKTRSVPRCTLYVLNSEVHLREMWWLGKVRGAWEPLVGLPTSVPFLKPSFCKVILVFQRFTVAASAISSIQL